MSTIFEKDKVQSVLIEVLSSQPEKEQLLRKGREGSLLLKCQLNKVPD